MTGDRKAPARCGTEAGYQRHLRGSMAFPKDKPCDLCVAASRRARRSRDARRAGGSPWPTLDVGPAQPTPADVSADLASTDDEDAFAGQWVRRGLVWVQVAPPLRRSEGLLEQLMRERFGRMSKLTAEQPRTVQQAALARRRWLARRAAA